MAFSVRFAYFHDIQCFANDPVGCDEFLKLLDKYMIEMVSTVTTKAIEYDKCKTLRSDFRKHSLLGQQLSRKKCDS